MGWPYCFRIAVRSATARACAALASFLESNTSVYPGAPRVGAPPASTSKRLGAAVGIPYGVGSTAGSGTDGQGAGLSFCTWTQSVGQQVPRTGSRPRPRALQIDLMAVDP